MFPTRITYCYIIHVEVRPVKSVDKGVAVSGEELLYTTEITNVGSLPISDVYFTNPIPVGAAFVNGSVTVNGASVPAADPALGFPLPNILPGQSVTVTFRVTVD